MAFLGALGFCVGFNGGVCLKEAPKAVPMTATSGLALEPA
jgi:hypothetical protein